MNMDRFKYRAYFNFAEECTGLKDSTKWEELTPAEQKEWCRSHASAEWEGKVRASQQKKVKWEELTPAEQKEWCRSHASAEWEGKVRASQQKKVWRFPGRVKRKEKAR